MINNDRESYPPSRKKDNLEPSCHLEQNKLSQVLAVKWSSRWDVFRRLKELEINCQCSTNEPLLVHLHSPATAIQIWSVVRQFNGSRQELIGCLHECWQIRYDHKSR